MADIRFMTPRVLLMRRQLYEQGEHTPERRDYIAKHGLDVETIRAHAGVFTVVLAQLIGHNSGVARWDFDPEGVPAAVIEALHEDAVTVADLIAWPLNAPERFARAIGEAEFLGIPTMRARATYAAGRALKVHRTPLDWIKAGCTGCVPLVGAASGYWLSCCPGPFLAADLQHGEEIRRLMGKAYVPGKVRVRLDLAT